MADYAGREPLYLSLKAVGDEDERIFEGYASTEALDQQGDIVTKSALAPALEGFLKRGKITLEHDKKKVIGKPLEAVIDDVGLRVKGFIAKGSAVADEAWALMKQGVLDGLSIGFLYGKKDVEYRNGRKVYKSMGDLFDCAVTAFPINRESYIFAVKSAGYEIEPQIIEQAESWLSSQLEGASDEWRAVAKSACVLFGARGGCDLDTEARKAAWELLAGRYEGYEKELPEFEGDWPESFKAVSFKSNEQHIYEEETAGANLREIARRAGDVQSIASHWAKEGLQLSEATRTELETAKKSLEALLEVGAPPTEAQEGDLVTGLLKTLAGGK